MTAMVISASGSFLKEISARLSSQMVSKNSLAGLEFCCVWAATSQFYASVLFCRVELNDADTLVLVRSLNLVNIKHS